MPCYFDAESYSDIVTLCFLTGNNPLQRALFEADEDIDNPDWNHIESLPALWNYRTPVSIEHVQQLCENDDDSKQAMSKHKVLMLFLKEVCFPSNLLMNYTNSAIVMAILASPM